MEGFLFVEEFFVCLYNILCWFVVFFLSNI